MTKTAVSIFIATFGALWVGLALAIEPPQALGLVAAAEPVPMTCENGRCDTVVSAFCLQQHHRSPFPTDLYREAKKGDVRVVARTHTGVEILLPSEMLEFRPDPEYTAVRVSFTTSGAVDIDPASVHLTIAPNTSLVPIGIASDTALETAISTHRRVATQFFENGDDRGKAVRLVNRLINELPRTARAETDIRNAALRRANQTERDPAIRRWVRQLYHNCGKSAETSRRFTVRRCLVDWHHRSMSTTNKSFWAALAGV